MNKKARSMSKLNLNDYSDRELVAAFFNLPARKFMTVMNAMGAISQRMEKRGKLIAQDSSDEVVENMLRQLFEDEK